MTPEVFDQSLARTIEFREAVRGMDDADVKVRFGDVVSDMVVNDVKVSLCGLGEPLLNKHTPTFVRQIREAGLSCIMSSNGALLDRARGEALLDAGLDALHAAVKRTPMVAGLSSRDAALRGYQKLIDENLGTSIFINVVFALIMALGILYNAARITLADQARQLASLRVLGFRRREVAAMLLGELAGLTVLAIPCGMVVGYFLSMAMVEGMSSEQLRIPLVVLPRTYGVAAVTLLGAAALSGFVVWRALDKMDIIEVLKTRE
jgi:hypothetical protein